MNVFILCTGRCGSMSISRACKELDNYTSGHETRITKLGDERINFPENHIEADNRLAWFLGRLDEKYGNVIGIWRAKIAKGEPLPIVGDGEQKRDFIHVYDIVEGLQKIALSNLSHNDAWELGTGVNYSINKVYEIFNKRFNVEYENLPDQPGNYRKTLRENDDTLKLLNWTPKDRLEEHINNIKI